MIRSTIVTTKTKRNPLALSQTKELIKNQAVETDKRRGKNGLNSNIDNKTITTVLKDIVTSIVKGQTITKARHREKMDIRNMVTMAVINVAYAKDKMPQMIGNFDATHFIISGINDEILLLSNLKRYLHMRRKNHSHMQ